MSLFQKNTLIQEHGPEVVIDKLSPFVTSHRKERIETVLAGRLRDIQLAIEAPSDINNALAAVRSSEAFGISKVHLIAAEGDVNAARGVTQGAIYWIDVVFHDSFDDFLKMAHSEQLQLAGGIMNAEATLEEIPVDLPLCILVGNEQRGLSVKAQQACDLLYKIPMFGMTESFNLSVCAGVSLYDVTLRKRRQLAANSDLSFQEQQFLRAQFYLNSTAPRLAQGLLKG